MQFPLLFSPFTLKTTEFRNRIFSTGHDTYLPEDGLPSDALIAYQRARARGGAGLIVIQVVGVHETSRYTEALLMGTSDDCIPHFKRLVDAIHAEGTKVFIQLFHPGRELLGRPDGVIQPAFAPSHSPSERFHVIPREMSPGLIGEIVDGFGQAARRMAEAGADGVEIVASHGYLPAQFMNPNVNRRSDRYGGSLENRLRFTREAIAAIRANVPSHLIVGMRMSGDEHDQDGLTEDDSLAIARALKDELDYLNVIAGTSATASGATHIVPSMANAHGYVAPFARKVKQATGATVFVAGRINQPQIAEQRACHGGRRHVRHDARDDLRSRNAEQGAARRRRRHPRLHRLQSGLHRAFSARTSDLLHPASRNRARTAVREEVQGGAAAPHHGGGRRTGWTEGRGSGGRTRPSGDAARARRRFRRTGAAGAAAADPGGVRRHRRTTCRARPSARAQSSVHGAR